MKQGTLSGILNCAVIMGVAVMQIGCAGPVDRTANATFMETIGATSMTVFPAYVRRGKEVSYNSNAAKQIRVFLQDEGLAAASVVDRRVPLEVPWFSDQSRMLRESAVAFAAYLTEHPVDTEYALLPEYLGGRGAFGGVHCYIVDADNRITYVVLQNSHWPIFKDVDPKSVDDCTEILIRVLREDLTPPESKE